MIRIKILKIIKVKKTQIYNPQLQNLLNKCDNRLELMRKNLLQKRDSTFKSFSGRKSRKRKDYKEKKDKKKKKQGF